MTPYVIMDVGRNWLLIVNWTLGTDINNEILAEI